VPDKRIAGMMLAEGEVLRHRDRGQGPHGAQGKWKLTYQPLTDGAIYRLFDIERDPGAGKTSSAATGRGGELRSLLDQWMADDRDPIQSSPPKRRTEAADADPASRASIETAIARLRECRDEIRQHRTPMSKRSQR